MSQNVALNEDGTKTAIAPAVKLSTLQDFDRVIQAQKKANILLTLGGAVVFIIGLFSLGYIEEANIPEFLKTVIYLIIGFGFYEAVLRHAGGTPSFFKEIRKFQFWHREVTCTTCNQKAIVSIGFYEFQCPACKKINRHFYGTKRGWGEEEKNKAAYKEEMIAKSQECRYCHKPYYPPALPAQYTCPHCQKAVSIERFPIER